MDLIDAAVERRRRRGKDLVKRCISWQMAGLI